MTSNNPPHLDAVDERAAAAASAQRWLAIHGIAYVVVNTINVIVDAADGGDWRVHWTLLGWGIGLAAHATVVFWPGLLLGGWEQRRREHIAQQLRNEQENPS